MSLLDDLHDAEWHHQQHQCLAYVPGLPCGCEAAKAIAAMEAAHEKTAEALVISIRQVNAERARWTVDAVARALYMTTGGTFWDTLMETSRDIYRVTARDFLAAMEAER